MTLAVIMEMRKHVGLLVAVIGIAIVSFLAMDAINSSTGIFSNQDERFAGEIAGVGITAEDYTERSNALERRYLYFQGLWQDPNFRWSEEQKHSIRDIAWNQLLEQQLIAGEAEEMGLKVSQSELDQMLFSPNPNPQVRNFYSQVINPDPNAPFDPNQMRAAVQQIMAFTPNDPNYLKKDYYLQLLDHLREEQLRQKYMSLYRGSAYAPSWRVQQDLAFRNATADIKFVQLDYASIPDDKVKPTEKEMEEYLKKNRKEFDRPTTRAIEYVVFDILPTAKDTQAIYSEVMKRFEQFRGAKSDSIFINSYSEAPFVPYYQKKEDLSSTYADTFFVADTGTFIGPYLEDGKFKVAKVIDKQVMPDSVKVRHILVRSSEQGVYDSAQAVIDSVRGLLQAGTPFDTLATQFSQDQGTAIKGGEIGWLTPSDNVFKSLYNAIFIEHNTGDVFSVQTPLGVHLVEIMEASAKEPMVKVAVLERTIDPQQTTRDSMYNVVSRFYTKYNEGDSLAAGIKKEGLTPRYQDALTGNEFTIPGINVSARRILMWAFQAEEGDVRLFQDYDAEDNKYVIIHLTNIKEKGKPSVEDFEEEIRQAVIREKKAKMLQEKLASAKSGASNLNQVAQKVNAQVKTALGVSFQTQMIEGAGVEPNVASVASSLEKGKISQPIKGNQGVYIIEVTQKNQPQASQDIANDKLRMQNNLQSRFGQGLLEEMKRGADVTDERYKFY